MGALVVFDLETTFDGVNRCSILQIAAQTIPADPRMLGARFDTFVNPHRTFDPRTVELCKIKEADLDAAPSTKFALKAFLAFLVDAQADHAMHVAHNIEFMQSREIIQDHHDDQRLINKEALQSGLVLIAHNGKAFDFRILLREMLACDLTFAGTNLENIRFGDTKDVFFRHPLKAMVGHVTSRAWSLGHVYKTVLGREMRDAHDARGDVRGLCEILAAYTNLTEKWNSCACEARSWVHITNTPSLRILFSPGIAFAKCTMCNAKQQRGAHPEYSPYWCTLHRYRRANKKFGLERLRALVCFA